MLIITHHARQRMQARGLTEGNIYWCIAANHYYIQNNGTRHYSRVYDNGNSSVHVITDGNRLVSCWIRGRLDPNV
jgi:hypothetical protein